MRILRGHAQDAQTYADLQRSFPDFNQGKLLLRIMEMCDLTTTCNQYSGMKSSARKFPECQSCLEIMSSKDDVPTFI